MRGVRRPGTGLQQRGGLMKAEVIDRPVRVAERRLTERVRRQWASAAHGRLPSLREMEALALGADRDFCFAVDLRLSDIFPYFVFLGDGLERYAALYQSGDARSERSLLDVAMMRMDEAALNRAPVEFSEIKRLATGKRIAFRAILLPLSENGVDVTHVFGAARGRGV